VQNVLNQTIVRTERGLTIAGTRITIYQVMDYLNADQPIPQIKEMFRLSDEQMNGVLEYIAQHPQQVDDEYQGVLQQAEASRVYWEERNRERFQTICKLPPSPGKEALYERLKQRKSELGMP